MKKYAYILLAALGFASCNYLEIDPIGQVIPHKTSEYRALLTEGYFRFPYIDSKALTGMLSDETDYLYDGKLYSSNYVALSQISCGITAVRCTKCHMKPITGPSSSPTP